MTLNGACHFGWLFKLLQMTIMTCLSMPIALSHCPEQLHTTWMTKMKLKYSMMRLWCHWRLLFFVHYFEWMCIMYSLFMQVAPSYGANLQAIVKALILSKSMIYTPFCNHALQWLCQCLRCEILAIECYKITLGIYEIHDDRMIYQVVLWAVICLGVIHPVCPCSILNLHMQYISIS